MKPVIQPRAQEDILNQVEYLLDAFAYDAAERFPTAVEEACVVLLRNPEIGAQRKYLAQQLSGLRSWPVPGFEDIRLYYIAERDVLRIVRVIHGRRDLPAVLDEG